ncbi:hypothetical protein [Peribacillus kribbensis]|uniref:hypothetical protein n=1 Tax=Peribacillus kribbensis TaxID=356658 RepID=UPI0004790CB5|nr:hypothetical protein [Peribacillus kribbensis]
MKIYIKVKSLAKRNRYIEQVLFKFSTRPSSLRELITAIVIKNVDDYNAGEGPKQILGFLSASDIQSKASSGKVGFSHKYENKKQELQQSINISITAFEDGLYKVFIGEEEIEDLNTPIQLEDENVITFLRVTMLTGRMW